AFKVEETLPHRVARCLEVQEATTLLPSSTGTAPLARFGFEELGQALRDATFVRYCVISLILFTVMSQLISTLSVYAVQWPGISKVQLVGLYTLNGLMVVFLQFPVVRALSPYRMTTALGALALVAAAGYWDLRQRLDRSVDRATEASAAETAVA